MAEEKIVQVNFRISESEKRELDEKVKRSRLSQKEYLLRSALEKEIIDMEPLKDLLLEMKRQGVNLNQVAKKLNAQGYVDYNHELKDVLKEVETAWQSLRQYLHTHQ